MAWVSSSGETAFRRNIEQVAFRNFDAFGEARRLRVANERADSCAAVGELRDDLRSDGSGGAGNEYGHWDAPEAGGTIPDI
jgi:hypothetical protein